MAVEPVPEGYHTLTTYLSLENASEAIEYYKRVSGAQERIRMDGPNASVVQPSNEP